MPVVDQIAAEYEDEVKFVAVAWKGTPEDTASRAAELLPSGAVSWGLDAEEQVFEAYGVPYQPATVLIDADRRVVDSWAGARDENAMRDAIDQYLLEG